MNIRPATGDDFAAIKAVAREAWHDTYDELDEALIDRTVDAWYTDDTMPLEAPGTVVLVVEESDLADETAGTNDIVGFTHAVAQGETADILRMYVVPAAQGQGIGTTLHERLLVELEAHDVEGVRAFDFAFNDVSRRFYESMGFEQTDTGEVEIEGEHYDEAVYATEL
ncbi:GNAT family N-acetyltransferase [Salinadaptatus halalkaliphilus]|uniref:GNAT family N-acetyltransferase n=1 Tax=Salinadaptatus halalkaliphilus TaxID=2419781 RepID=A0A4S3TRK2_9EURY|nr:GNAT family N-acetyltransferase [Salinadaptatus halalkaliphilus]THE66290.1 GNAT family N-acetyltransferase [Salinadaptatus halalkaliphilus]